VRSVAVADPGPLVRRLPPESGLAWVRHGDGLVGWGELTRAGFSGPDRFARAAEWWQEVCTRFVVEDAVGLAGSGPVAFGSFSFAAEGTGSLVVPRYVLGRRDGRAWLTTFGADTAAAATAATPPPRPPGLVRWSDGTPVAAWRAAVAEAVARIGRGELDKVVLARDLVAMLDEPLDPRWLLERLAASYDECWTFAVDGMVGATPELLVWRRKSEVSSRVLAGTVRSRGDAAEDSTLAVGLLGSAKDLEEHEYAVRSVAQVLARHCSDIVVPQAPYILRLANVQHLATDITGQLLDDTSSLALAAALHPSAAVCGTPTDRALAAIGELEGMDRGRYAGPVGWMDASGDGEWGIALRCAEVDGARLRLFAGCGIVAGSDPDAELAETHAKLVAVRDALEAD